MNLNDFHHLVNNWMRFYKMKGIPPKKIEVVFTMHESDRDDLVQIEKKDIEHGHYEARKEDFEVVGGYKGKLYFISLHGFNPDNGMDKEIPEEELAQIYK